MSQALHNTDQQSSLTMITGAGVPMMKGNSVSIMTQHTILQELPWKAEPYLA